MLSAKRLDKAPKPLINTSQGGKMPEMKSVLVIDDDGVMLVWLLDVIDDKKVPAKNLHIINVPTEKLIAA